MMAINVATLKHTQLLIDSKWKRKRSKEKHYRRVEDKKRDMKIINAISYYHSIY